MVSFVKSTPDLLVLRTIDYMYELGRFSKMNDERNRRLPLSNQPVAARPTTAGSSLQNSTRQAFLEFSIKDTYLINPRNDKTQRVKRSQWKSIKLTISFPHFSRANPSIYMYVPFPKCPCNPVAPPPKRGPSPSLFASIKIQTKHAKSSPNTIATTKHQKRVQLREAKTNPVQSKIPKALKVSLACKSDACSLENPASREEYICVIPSFIGYQYHQTRGHRFGKASIRFVV
jgi:hypothetical protein